MDLKELKELIQKDSLKEYAKYIGVHETTVYRWEKIPRQYKRLTIERIEMMNAERMEFISLLDY